MKKKITTLFLLALGATTYAQQPGVGIGTPLPRQSAALEVLSDDKGVLIPRIALLKTNEYQLNGGAAEGAKSEVKGMLIFNTTEVKGTGPDAEVLVNVGFHFWNGAEWVHITSEKELTKIATEIRTEVKEQIKKITEIEAGTGDDKSYMVVYDPKNEKLYYLVPDGKGGYTPGDVTFADLVKGSETTTEIKAIIDGKNDDGEDKIVAYVYFNEVVVNEWVKDKAGNTIANIPNDRGFKIDVLDVVTHSFDKVIEKNTDKITEVIRESEGNVRVVDVAGKPVLQYKPKGSDDY
ncbi:calcium-binding protein, partial [Myroides odoratimimus]